MKQLEVCRVYVDAHVAGCQVVVNPGEENLKVLEPSRLFPIGLNRYLAWETADHDDDTGEAWVYVFHHRYDHDGDEWLVHENSLRVVDEDAKFQLFYDWDPGCAISENPNWKRLS
ncbi:MAG TPA: hypothetical protein VLF21_01055 [Candidatus Saccharimonadales bacterium]|nr:hypothetical protein [Candidatus Saccharimonadales bacterium]